jgi:chromosome segregation ATPase
MDKLETRMDKIENKIDKLETRMDAFETRMDKFETGMDKLEISTAQNSLVLENEVSTNIRIIAEQHMSIVEKINDVNAKLDNQNMRYDFLEMQVKSNKVEIEKLKMAN